MSGDFVKLMRKSSMALCRKIDKCTIKGYATCHEIWTFDVNIDRLGIEVVEAVLEVKDEHSSMDHNSIFQKNAKPIINTTNIDDVNINNFANQMILTTNNEQEGDNMMSNLKIENEQLYFESKSTEEPSPLETHPVMSE